MKASIAALFSLLLLGSTAAAQSAQPAKLPDLPFVGDLIRLRETTVELLKIVHRHAAPSSKSQIAFRMGLRVHDILEPGKVRPTEEMVGGGTANRERPANPAHW